ncbi:MAG TPA: gluconate 2-dehydrogenase subunit 3 family protein [Cyclobacteriaceae bacterium]|jgi:gluconate 2-dehydrogenase gamma chain|nr:gluconate 2-dehydrogenase subunit 3 family protein [Cytophagales bacterium]HRE67061.1 gluconate 2-dehydrogenase subunit 3 family protein [Cyclobacteriaceae bacterium]HRF32328.1 gluconate 2-dehydrogenase subunit 3 family protein [Cyclobacteriaceae bacterium]
MDRREAIQRAGLILGYAITGPTLIGVLNGCKATPRAGFIPVFFSNEQGALIEILAEIIIPETDTPGAKEAGVPQFIDTLIANVYTKEQQDKFIADLIAFDADASTTLGQAFINCTPEEQVQFFEKHHTKAISDATDGGPTGWWNAGSGSDKPFVLKVKELVLAGYFTSEPGATQALQYNPVPGPFRGCVPYAEVGKAWAT